MSVYDNWEEDPSGWRRRPEPKPLLYTIFSYLIRLALLAGVLVALYFTGTAFYNAITNPSFIAAEPTTVPGRARTPTVVAAVITPTATVTPTPQSTPTATPGVVGLQFRVANTGNDGVILRSQPSRQKKTQIGLMEGTIVTVIAPIIQSEGEAWYQVRLQNGTTGYIPAEYLVPQ